MWPCTFTPYYHQNWTSLFLQNKILTSDNPFWHSYEPLSPWTLPLRLRSVTHLGMSYDLYLEIFYCTSKFLYNRVHHCYYAGSSHVHCHVLKRCKSRDSTVIGLGMNPRWGISRGRNINEGACWAIAIWDHFGWVIIADRIEKVKEMDMIKTFKDLG